MSATMNQWERLGRFCGWYRATKRHRWQKLVQADDYGTAWRKLLDAIASMPGGESLVTDHDPNSDRRCPR